MDETWRTAFTLSGTVIGAGVLGIPYVISKSGFILGLFEIFLFWLALTAVSLMVAEVLLRTNRKIQLTGLAKEYLGEKAGMLMFATVFLGVYGALIAYVIGFGEVLSAVFGLSPLHSQLIFFFVASAIVFSSVKVIEKVESILAPLSVFLLLSLSVFLLPGIHLENLLQINYSDVLVPAGVLLFAFAGVIAIPNLEEGLSNKKNLKKAIIIGMLIPLVLYIFFTLAVVGATGNDINEVATITLANKFGGTIMLIGYLFTVVAMTTPFLSLSESLKNSYIEDFGKSNLAAWIIVCFPLLLVILFQIASFVQVIALTGIFSIGISALLEIEIYKKVVGSKKSVLISGLIAFFLIIVIWGLFGLIPK